MASRPRQATLCPYNRIALRQCVWWWRAVTEQLTIGTAEGQQAASDSRRSSRSGRGSEPPSQGVQQGQGGSGTPATTGHDESSLPSQAVQHSQGRSAILGSHFSPPIALS